MTNIEERLERNTKERTSHTRMAVISNLKNGSLALGVHALCNPTPEGCSVVVAHHKAKSRLYKNTSAAKFPLSLPLPLSLSLSPTPSLSHYLLGGKQVAILSEAHLLRK